MYIYIYGWWFQTWLYFPFHIWDVILPIDELTPSFFKMGTLHHQPDGCTHIHTSTMAVLAAAMTTDAVLRGWVTWGILGSWGEVHLWSLRFHSCGHGY